MQPQPQPPVIVSQPYVMINGGSSLTVGVKATRGLGITQIVFGSLTFSLGILNISLLNFWTGYVGFAIWGGIWIVVGGVVGVGSAANTSSKCLNGTNMAFAIVSTLFMVIDLAFYAISVGEMRNYVCDPSYYYTNCYYTTNLTGVAIYSSLLAVSVVELGISVAVAILCCKYGCSGCCDRETRRVYGCSGCCDRETRGMVVQQPYMAPSSAFLQPGAQPSSYQTFGYQPTSYPAASYPHGYQQPSYPAASYPHGYQQPSYPAASNPYGFGPSAPPPCPSYQQGTYTTADSTYTTAQPLTVTQPTTITSHSNIPEEKQATPP